MDAFAVSENILAEQGNPDVKGNKDTETSVNSEESNKFQRAISSWRGRIQNQSALIISLPWLTSSSTLQGLTLQIPFPNLTLLHRK
jgi:hypothetical protein